MESNILNNPPLLAIVTPCYNEEEVLPQSFGVLNSKITQLISQKLISPNSFICFVDDGSSDGTWNILSNLARDNNQIRAIKLSTNKGHQNALLAGLSYVYEKCDCCVSIDCDLQQDIGVLDEFIQKYEFGNEVVLGVRNDRQSDSVFKKYSALFFYNMMKFFGVKIAKNHADYRLLSNRALGELLKFQETNLFLRGIVQLIGYKTDIVKFNVRDRFAGDSKYPLKKMLSFALEGVTSFSVVPLRFVSAIGFSIFIISFMLGLYGLGVKLFTDESIPGWASTVVPMYFLGGIQLLSLGIIGEYIGKIYKEVKHRPRYFIEEIVE